MRITLHLSFESQKILLKNFEALMFGGSSISSLILI